MCEREVEARDVARVALRAIKKRIRRFRIVQLIIEQGGCKGCDRLRGLGHFVRPAVGICSLCVFVDSLACF